MKRLGRTIATIAYWLMTLWIGAYGVLGALAGAVRVWPLLLAAALAVCGTVGRQIPAAWRVGVAAVGILFVALPFNIGMEDGPWGVKVLRVVYGIGGGGKGTVAGGCTLTGFDPRWQLTFYRPTPPRNQTK